MSYSPKSIDINDLQRKETLAEYLESAGFVGAHSPMESVVSEIKNLVRPGIDAFVVANQTYKLKVQRTTLQLLQRGANVTDKLTFKTDDLTLYRNNEKAGSLYMKAFHDGILQLARDIKSHHAAICEIIKAGL